MTSWAFRIRYATALQTVEVNMDHVETFDTLDLFQMTGCTDGLTNVPALDSVTRNLVVEVTDCVEVEVPMLETSDNVIIKFNTALEQVNMLRLTTSGSITLLGCSAVQTATGTQCSSGSAWALPRPRCGIWTWEMPRASRSTWSPSRRLALYR